MMEGSITPKINAEEKEDTKSHYSSNDDEKFYKLIVTTKKNECDTKIFLFLTVNNIYEFFTKHQRYIANKLLNESLGSITYSVEDDVEIEEVHYLNKNADPYDVRVILSNKNHSHIISLEYDLLKEAFKENYNIDFDLYKIRIYKTVKNDVFVRFINASNNFDIEASITILNESNKIGIKFWDLYLEKYYAKYSK